MSQLVLRPYQREGRDFLAGRRHAMLADEMRVGKSPQAILAADAINAESVIVTCPAIATEHWRREWAKWSPERPPAVVLGVDVAKPPPTCFKGVLIASYTRATTWQPQLRDHAWDVFIPDEAHFAKNPDALRTKMVYGKAGIGWKANRIWPLTGTPAPNHAGELWPMLRAFGVVKADYNMFIRHYCYVGADGRVYGNKPEHLKELRQIIAPVIKRRTRKQVAPEMPEIAYGYLEFEPGRVDLKTEDVAKVDPEDRIAVATAKARQLADEIVGCLEAGDYKQTVVFGFHLAPLAELERVLKSRGIAVEQITGKTPSAVRESVQARFALGTTKVLLGQIIACGTAIDLSAADHGYLLELDYVPDNNAQAANRLVTMQEGHRFVSIDVCTWPGTIDDKVQRSLMRKVDTRLIS